jgi:hypothetical protein
MHELRGEDEPPLMSGSLHIMLPDRSQLHRAVGCSGKSKHFNRVENCQQLIVIVRDAFSSGYYIVLV